MNAIQVKAGVPSQLRFQVDVEGTDTPVREVRLSVMTESLKVGYRGVLKENVAVFTIRDLESHVKLGQAHDFDLEVYVGSNYFAPYSGKIEVVQPVSVSVSEVGSSPMKVEATLNRVDSKVIVENVSDKKDHVEDTTGEVREKVGGLIDRIFSSPSKARRQKDKGAVGVTEIVQEVRKNLFG